MVFRRFGTFTGGIDLPDEKEATIDAAIAPAGRLRTLRVPLAPVEAAPAMAIVQPGQRVSRGQKLATADGDEQVDVFAPLAGRVAGLAEAALPVHPTGWRLSPAVELTDLAGPEHVRRPPARFEWQAADERGLGARIAAGGLVTSRAPVVPLAGWIATARKAKVDTLIANVMENTPLVTADHRVLAEHGAETMGGLAILARAAGTSNVMLAVDHRRTGCYRSAVRHARSYGVQAVALAHKYPIGADAILVKVLRRREVAPGKGPFSVGVAVTNAATCWATYRWVVCGDRPTARVVTVGGPRVAAPGNLLVPFGADAGEVLASAGLEGDSPGVHGPPMTGRALAAGAVVAPETNALLGLRWPEVGPPTPCIRCGWCIDNCPARLNVAALNDDFELGRIDRARRRMVTACVDCGICSYVCPARLPLAGRVLLLKQAVHQVGRNAQPAEVG